MARATDAVQLMVIDVVTRSRRDVAERTSKSASVETDTPRVHLAFARG